MKATLANYRQSPRKVRLVADLVKGKSVPEALATLNILVKRAGGPIEKLMKSAAANAKKDGFEAKDLVVKDVRVDKGVTAKRIMPRARGSAYPIKKRSSNVTVIHAEKK